MVSKTQIELILQTKSITDYLAENGKTPETSVGTKWKYLCPFPDHNETKPSFVVFKNGTIETFWCFGCNRGITLVQLMMGLEGLTYQQAVQKLVPDSSFTSEDEIKVLLSQIEKYKDTISPDVDIGNTIINLSSMCFAYLDKVKNNPEEVKVMDKFYCQLDKDILDLNIDNIEDTLHILPKVLCKRKELYKQRRLEERKKEIKNGQDQ